MTSPLDPIKKIAEALNKEAQALGLQMQSFVIIPDMTGDAHLAQGMFIVADESVPSDNPDEDELVAQALKEFEEWETRAAEEAKTKEAIERALNLSERLDDGGSFLDD